MVIAMEPRFIGVDVLSQYGADENSTPPLQMKAGILKSEGSDTGLGFRSRHGALTRASLRAYDEINRAIHKLRHIVENRLVRLESSVHYYFNNRTVAADTGKPAFPLQSQAGDLMIDIVKVTLTAARQKLQPLEQLNGETITFAELEALYVQNKGNGPLRSIATLGNFLRGKAGILLRGDPEKLKAHCEFLACHPDLDDLLARTTKWGDDRVYDSRREAYADDPVLFREQAGTVLCGDLHRLIQVFQDYEWRIFPETRPAIEALPATPVSIPGLQCPPEPGIYKQLLDRNFEDIPFMDEP